MPSTKPIRSTWKRSAMRHFESTISLAVFSAMYASGPFSCGYRGERITVLRRIEDTVIMRNAEQYMQNLLRQELGLGPSKNGQE